MMKTNLLKEAWARMIMCNSFALACHQRPDGDTLGSALALAHILRLQGKDVIVLSEDGVPENYEFIPESETILTNTDRREFDCGIIVDSEAIKRVGRVAEVITSSWLTVCVDHHITEEAFGEIRIVNEKASSTAEVVVDLLDSNDISLDTVSATQLLTGIVADTGAFRFSNTTSRTLRIAARLVDAGGSPADITREIYYNQPIRAAKLLGRALDSMEMDDSGRVVWAMITQKDLSELGATDADTDSIVNQVGAVKGPKVALLLRETEPNSIRISLRSKGDVDVNQIARVFGGGGHIAASGCTINAPIDEARERIVAEVLKWMES